MRRKIFRVLLTLLILYLLLLLAVMLFQRRLIYFPTKLTPEVADQIAGKKGFSPWRNKTGEIIGWRLQSASPAKIAVLIFHGNAGCALDRGYLAKPIHESDSADVYVFEYPGYGAREGLPNAKSFLRKAEEAFEQLPSDIPKFVVSESLGAGVAAHLAKKYSHKVSGLALFVPYNNLISAGQKQMPFIPVWLLLWDRFDPATWLKEYRGPVKIVVAGADEVIAPELGRRLHDEFTGPKSLQVIPGAHHNEVAAQTPEWWKGTFSFWEQNRWAK